MTIAITDIKLFASLVVADGPTNGGGMSINERVDGVANDIWEDVTGPQRTAGNELLKKLFAKVHTDSNEAFTLARLFNDLPTVGDDFIVLMPATDTDTEATMGTPRIYGVGSLTTDVSIGGQTLIVEVEDDTIAAMFVDGDPIRISDKASADSGSDNEEFHVINGTPSVVGSTVTITITDTLAYAYSATDSATKVASVFEHGTLQASYATPTKTGLALK